jgi:hypothetical protein
MTIDTSKSNMARTYRLLECLTDQKVYEPIVIQPESIYCEHELIIISDDECDVIVIDRCKQLINCIMILKVLVLFFLRSNNIHTVEN